MKKDKNKKRRLLLNKRLDQKTIEKNRAKFARPTESKLFVKANGTEAVRAPLNKRIIALILAIVMVLGLIPAGIFMLRPKAAEQLSDVTMNLIINGEDYGQVTIAPGTITDNINAVTDSLTGQLPNGCTYEKALMVDNGVTPATETEIVAVGSYNGKTYYSIDADTNTGTELTKKQVLKLVYSSSYNVTTNVSGGEVDCEDTIRHGQALHVVLTPAVDHTYSAENITYTIGDNTRHPATINNNSFTIPAIEIDGDITIDVTYPAVTSYSVFDARRLPNNKSKYYDLYGVDMHGDVIGDLGTSAVGQPFDSYSDAFSNWSANKFKNFQYDSVDYSQVISGSTYGNPGTRIFQTNRQLEENIATYTRGNSASYLNSDGTLNYFPPYDVTPGGTATFYLNSQDYKNGGTMWVLNMLSINGEDIKYPAGTTIGSFEETDISGNRKVRVELVAKDVGRYWYSSDISYDRTTLLQTRSFKGDRSTRNLWYYNNSNWNKYRSIYKVTVTNVHEDLEVAYNFKDSASREMIIKGLRGIAETAASKEERGPDNSLIGIIGYPTRNYTLNKQSTNIYPASYNSTYSLLDWSYPSNNLYLYRVKPGYNPYSVTSEDNFRTQYYNQDGAEADTSQYGVLANNSAERPDEAIITATKSAGDIAEELADQYDLDKSNETIMSFLRGLYSFNHVARYWGGYSGVSSELENRSTTRRQAYGEGSWDSKDLLLTTVAAEEAADSSKKWYAVALLQNEATNQQMWLNADPYEYHAVFDLNGGTYNGDVPQGLITTTLGAGNNERYEHAKNDAAVIYTLENGATKTSMPKGQPSKTDCIFLGWRLYQGNTPVDEDKYYQSNEVFTINGSSVRYSEGDERENENHTFTFKAEWMDKTDSNDYALANILVEYENANNLDSYVEYYRGSETQVVGDTILLNRHNDFPKAEYYTLNEEDSILGTKLIKDGTNNLYAKYDLTLCDFTVTKKVLGNPTQKTFPITITLTRDPGSPISFEDAKAMIAEGGVQPTAEGPNSLTYEIEFNRSQTASFPNVPYGWNVKVEEPIAEEKDNKLDFTTTITSIPETAGSQTSADGAETTVWEGTASEDTNITVTNKSDSYLVLDKDIDRNDDGTYKLTMEAYTTGDVQTERVTEKVPTDFIVVVDQSGSMDTRDMPTGEPTVQNGKYLEDIAAGSYYYREEVVDEEGNAVIDPDTNQQKVNYYRVYGVKDYLYRYYPANYWFTGDIVEHLGADIGWFMSETDATTNIDNAFYFREVVGDQTYYIPIRTTIEGKIGTYYMRFSYPSKKTGSTYEFNREVTTYSSNGNSPWYKNVLNGDVMTSGATWSAANAAVQTLYPNDNAYTYSTINLLLARPRTGMYINYPMYGRHLSYTKLCYRDVNGVEHEVPSNSNGRTTWEYCDDDGIARTTDSVTSDRPTYDGLYTFPGTTDRITALKAALTEFAGAVAEETDDFGRVDNRISIVGFSSSGYNNTELLTHTEKDITNGSTNGWQKGTADGNVSEYYGKALVSSTQGDTVGVVNPKITRAIDAITANGGTQPEDGLNMAYKILQNRGDKKFTRQAGPTKGQEEDRNTMVIFFTDGQPGDYHYSNQYSEANEVVQQAKYIKDYKVDGNSTRETSLFSIGVFGESDANPLTYADTTQSQSNRQSWKYLGGWMETYYSGGTYYCLRRQWRPNSSDGYTPTANDTIYDYMSVVSSNYPDAKNFIAPTWLTGGFQGNYIAATDGDDVRQKSTAESTNKYYRLASSQDTLIAAFESVISLDTEESTVSTIGLGPEDSVLRDVINSDYFVIPDDTSTLEVNMYTVNGTLEQGNSTPTWERENDQADGPEKRDDITDPDNYSWSEDRKTLNVMGFDYGNNYIAEGKPGQKLIVTISGLVPKQNAVGKLDSNTEESGVYKLTSKDGQEEPTAEMVDAFPIPNLYRYAYDLTETGAVVDNEFDVTLTLSDPASDSVLVTYNGDSRGNPETFTNGAYSWSAQDGDAIYLETKDKNVFLSGSVSAESLDQDNYTYSHFINNVPVANFGDTFDMKEDTSHILVHNVMNYRAVVIHLDAEESPYVDTGYEFKVDLELTGKDIAEKKTALEQANPGITFEGSGNKLTAIVTMTYDANGTPSTVEPVTVKIPDGASLSVSHSDYFYTTDPITFTDANTTTPAEYTEHAINLATDIYIVDKVNEEIGTGVMDYSSHRHVVLYVLAIMALIALGGTGFWLYRKKDDFGEAE